MVPQDARSRDGRDARRARGLLQQPRVVLTPHFGRREGHVAMGFLHPSDGSLNHSAERRFRADHRVVLHAAGQPGELLQKPTQRAGVDVQRVRPSVAEVGGGGRRGAFRDAAAAVGGRLLKRQRCAWIL